MSNDIYAISARVKNIIAKEDIALSPVGKVLVNYFTLALKNLYDFSETLPEPYKQQLNNVIESTENTPLLIIKVATPKEQPEIPYEQIAQFDSNEEALEFFQTECAKLAAQYGVTADELWFQAESSSEINDDYNRIRTLRRSIQMCEYLIEKES